MGSNKKRKWTVFFLIQAADSLTMKYMITSLRDLVRVQLSDEVAVLLAINFNRINLRALEKLDNNLIDQTNQPKQYTTMFYLLAAISGGAGNELKFIDEKAEFDITAADHVGVYLQQQILSHYKAKRYMVFTWDHGNGVTIFAGGDKENAQDSDYENIVPENKPKALTMDELGAAIKRARGGKKVNIVVMMNCLMMTLDTLYGLRDSTKYVVAPQSLLDFRGYDYRAILSKLAEQPDINSKKMTAYIMSNFQKNSESGGVRIFYLKGASIAAGRTADVDLFTFFLQELIKRLRERDAASASPVKTIMFDTEITVNSRSTLTDLYSLLTNLYPKATVEERNLILHLFALKLDLLFKTFLGKNSTSTGISMQTGISSSGFETTFQQKTQLPELLRYLKSL